MKPNLVVLHENHAYRYVNGKVDQVVEMNVDSNYDLKQLRKDIEHFRVNGLSFEDVEHQEQYQEQHQEEISEVAGVDA